jgi:hypothetical protein
MTLAVVSEGELRRGAFLTDRKRLFEVVDARSGRVCLENCRFPDEPPSWLEVRRVLRDMQLVRPAP